jgi:hypothetical protein
LSLKLNKKARLGWAYFKKGESSMDAFLKMIDDLQTPKHKTNHINTEDASPRNKIIVITSDNI